jgi:pyridoxine/pyridoxamine 5'-phosphate oxidase
MCGGYLGIKIGENGYKPIEPVRGQCSLCSYQIAWALIRPRPRDARKGAAASKSSRTGNSRSRFSRR